MINTFGRLSLHRGLYLRTIYFYFWTEGAKRKVIDDREQDKRQRREEEWTIHCCNYTGELATLKDLESWKTLLNATTIRNYEPLLEIAKSLGERELPKATYHRQCRGIFTLKRNLDKLSQLDAKERANCDSTDSRRSSIRQPKTADVITRSLCLLFNQSRSSGTIPMEWKLANTVPVFKKGDRQQV